MHIYVQEICMCSENMCQDTGKMFGNTVAL